MDIQLWITFAIGIVTFCLVSILIANRRPKGLRGPFVIPLIGTFYRHGMSTIKLTELAKEYGDLCSIYLGPRHTLLLNSYEAIKTAMQGKAFVDRGLMNTYTRLLSSPKRKGVIICDYNPTVKSRRSLCLSTMRDLGVGRSAMEDHILEEADQLVNVFRRYSGQPFDITNAVDLSVANIILRICFNVSYAHDDDNLLRLIKYHHDYVGAVKGISVIDSLPIIRHIEPYKTSLKNYLAGNKALIDYFWEQARPFLDEKNTKLDICFAHNYIEKWRANEKEEELDMEQFQYIMRDLLIGGLGTTSVTLLWLVIMVANRKNVQEQLQSEIDKILGEQGTIRMSDKDHLHYTQAVILETQRFCTTVPIMFFAASQNTTLLGAEIPKGTFTLANYYSVHHSNTIWGDPEVFRPERFLTVDGKFQSNDHVLPFGIGKRSCLGELLARQELFLFTVKLFQNFSFKPQDDSERICEDVIDGFVRNPRPFKIRAIEKNC